jgi:hypothetical protein
MLFWPRCGLGYEQQSVGVPGGFGGAVSSWLGCLKVLQPVCQDTQRLGQGRHAVLEHVHAVPREGRLRSWPRRGPVIIGPVLDR